MITTRYCVLLALVLASVAQAKSPLGRYGHAEAFATLRIGGASIPLSLDVQRLGVSRHKIKVRGVNNGLRIVRIRFNLEDPVRRSESQRLTARSGTIHIKDLHSGTPRVHGGDVRGKFRLRDVDGTWHLWSRKSKTGVRNLRGDFHHHGGRITRLDITGRR